MKNKKELSWSDKINVDSVKKTLSTFFIIINLKGRLNIWEKIIWKHQKKKKK